MERLVDLQVRVDLVASALGSMGTVTVKGASMSPTRNQGLQIGTF
jgi:hypothetical protein